MKLLDLFTGIGGFSLAFKRIFPDGEIIGFSEIDKYATSIYQKHFFGVKPFGNITTIRERELPDFDICTFGFPCQDLSIAGKREGFAGQRSSLFHEAIRIINWKRPKYFIFENVKGLFSSRKGADFIEVLQTITNIGYSGQWQMLNTKWFLPQNRERIYFVGHLTGEPRPEIFPIGENNIGFNEGKRETTINTITAGGHSGGLHSNMTLISNSATNRKWEKRENNIVPTLRANTGAGHNDLIQIGDVSLKGSGSLSGRVYDPKGIAINLNGNGGGAGAKTGLYAVALTEARTEEAKQIRRLIPIECERLQGYPDNYTEGISDTQRYKCLGNSITVNVAQEIFRKLSLSISKENLFKPAINQ